MWNPGFILIIVIAVVGMIVQARLQSVFKKYSQVMFPGGLTGREVAEKMLHDNGIYDVKVTATQGHLTDHYNPATKTVNLSESVYNSNSVSAAAVAAHECGHAVQHARDYAPLKMRSALVPIVQFSSMWSTWVIIAGILLINTFPALFWVWISMIKALYLRRKDRLEQGKKMTDLDERYFKTAEDNLYSELALSLGMKKDEMVSYITERVLAEA